MSTTTVGATFGEHGPGELVARLRLPVSVDGFSAIAAAIEQEYGPGVTVSGDGDGWTSIRTATKTTRRPEQSAAVGQLADRVVNAIRSSVPFTYTNEVSLHQELREALDGSGIDCVREFRLDSHSRIDLYAPHGAWGVGIEVKIAGTPYEVLEQLLRYSRHDQIGALVLVTTVAAHRSLLDAWTGATGCPLHVVSLIGQGL